jgi:hypothetical protein
MKTYYFTWFVAISFSLLSGCAYLQGRHDQDTAKPKSKPAAVTQDEAPAPTMYQRSNPATNASKMIAPITQ